jgi:hypothetical protein
VSRGCVMLRFRCGEKCGEEVAAAKRIGRELGW